MPSESARFKAAAKFNTMNPKTIFVLSTLVLASLLGAGCASPAQSSAMIPVSVDLPRKHAASVSVAADGGQETKPMETSEISTEAFVEAVSGAIRQSGVFSSVLQGANADYRLTILIVSVDQPLIGFDMTVKMSTHWKLAGAKGESVFEDFIRSSHTATVGDAFAGVKRLRMATEGAARENIKIGLQRISALDL